MRRKTTTFLQKLEAIGRKMRGVTQAEVDEALADTHTMGAPTTFTWTADMSKVNLYEDTTLDMPLTYVTDPVLARLWDNEDDAVYDEL